MKKMIGFTIKKISMSGFKCFEETTSFDFGDTTFITASNGQGKSSIADAIAFAFVGTPFFGDRGLDRLHNKNTDEMAVSIDFIDDKDEAHNLSRIRKYDATTIVYNGVNIRQADLNAAFGDKDTFLSILNPLYFINVLGDNGKGLLEKLLPVVKHAEVLAALSESSQEILANQSLLSPETFIKKRRADLKKSENILIGYRSRSELLEHQREERAAKTKELQEAIDTLNAEIATLVAIRDDGRDITADEISLAELCKRKDEMLSETTRNSIDKAMQDIRAEIKMVEMSVTQQTKAQYSSPYTVQLAEAKARLKVLYDEHGRISTILSNTAIGYKCPTCEVKITAKNIDAVKADLQSRISTLINEGKSAKANLAEIKSQNDAAGYAFEEQKKSALKVELDKLAALNRQLEELNVACELGIEDFNEQLLALENQISEQKYRLTNGNLTQEQASKLNELEKSKKESEVKAKALNDTADDDYDVLIDETEIEITRLKQLISEAIQYMAKRIELMLDGLKMNKTEIVLTEIVKTTGEIKDCFRFSYEGRDYKCLSLSEKVKAGLEVSTLIQRLSGRSYPIFVDNGESICSFGNIKFSGQLILTRVVRSQELQVTYKQREQAEAAA